MLGSDVKADIVHTFADKSSPLPWLPAAVLGGGRGVGEVTGSGDGALTPPPPASFSVTSYWAMHFHALRELCLGGSQRAFVASLATSTKWSASGGKSGARFERSSDRRFVTKHISKTEFDMFVTHVAPAYFAHMRASLLEGLPTVLVRIHGVYKVVASTHSRAKQAVGVAAPSVAVPGGGTQPGSDRSLGLTQAGAAAGGGIGGGGALAGGGAGGGVSVGVVRKHTYYVLVMDDLFFNCSIPPGMKFDLKGKSRAQKRPAAGALLRPPLLPGGGGAGAAAGYLAIAAPVPQGEDYNPFGGTPALPAASPLHPQQQQHQLHGGVGGAGEGGLARSGSVAESGLQSGPAGGARSRLEQAAPSAATTASAPPLDAQATAAAVPDDTVLLDGDFLAFTRGLPLPLSDESKRLLDAAVRRDTEFLCRANVVDYSLLVGVDPASGSLVVGIIDYIRRFDLAKQLESRVKTVTALATNVEPTVVQPARYLERLHRALDRYFILVPQKLTVPPR